MALSKSEADRARSIHVFSNVSEACLPSLLKLASMRYFPARTVLFNEGDRATALYSLIHIPYGKRVLASHLGMAPENLSRNLASLAPLGVAVRGRHVSLNDRAALAQFARLA